VASAPIDWSQLPKAYDPSAHTDTHARTHVYMYTYTHTRTHPQTHIDRKAHRHMHVHSHTQVNAIHTHTVIDPSTHRYTLMSPCPRH
jgi:hypothetical protein